MPYQRQCRTCNRPYPETASLCVYCPQTPVPLVDRSRLPATLMIGQDVNNPTPLGTNEFEIERVLGAGAMGIAYLAIDQLGTRVVVKEMLPRAKKKINDKLVFNFLREATIQYALSQQFQHRRPVFPPLPQGYGWFQIRFQDPQNPAGSHVRPFMVMEFMEGSDLDRVQDQIGAMSELDVAQIGMELCVILRDYFHSHRNPNTGDPEPIVHRDIKPANIQQLLATGTVSLLDLGISRSEIIRAGTQARGGTKAGTEGFGAPEQFDQSKQATTRADLYALCATLYCLLANDKGFSNEEDPSGQLFGRTRAQQVGVIWAKVRNPDLQALLIKGTNESPAARHASAEELRAELAEVYEATQPLPWHLRQAAPLAPQPAPAQPGGGLLAPPPPPGPPKGRIVIEWEDTPVTQPSQGQYHQDRAGRVIRRWGMLGFRKTQGLGGLIVRVDRIVDLTGPPPQPQTTSTGTDQDGNFVLEYDDTTVPIDVNERRLTVVVEEATGQELYREIIQITHPQRGFSGARRAIGNAIGNFFHGADPVKASLTVSALLVLITFSLAFVQKMSGWDQMMYIWVHTIIAAVFIAFLAFRMRNRGWFTTKQRTFGQALKSPLLIGGAVLWVAGTLVYWFQ